MTLNMDGGEMGANKPNVEGTFRIADVDEVSATLTVTMKIGDWKRLRGQLANHYPSFKLEEMVKDMIEKASVVFDSDGEYKG